jgi:hypothetical protein
MSIFKNYLLALSLILIHLFFNSCEHLFLSNNKKRLFGFNKEQNKKSDEIIPSIRFHALIDFNRNKTIEIKRHYESKNDLNLICPQSSKPFIKLIVHGFAETWNMSFRWNWVSALTREMFRSVESEKLCVIAVDWKELARGGTIIANYWTAIENMKITGDLMVEYFRNNKINEKNLHCIGFSLGAHMCGIFGKIFYENLKFKIGRITGLDPAGTKDLYLIAIYKKKKKKK